MPPPSLNRRPSMPVLNVVRDEPQQLERTRSLAAAGRSPTLGSIRSARQRAGSIAAPSADADEGGSAAAEPVHFATRHEDDVVRPPSRINSARSGGEDGAAAPAVAPQKVLVKRLKSTTAAQRSTMPNPAAHHSSRFSGDEVDSHQGSVNVPSDSDGRQNSGRQHWSDGATNFVAFAGNSGYRSGGDGGESDPYQVVPVSLVGSGGEEERTVTSARGGGGDDVTSQHPRSASASHTAPQPHHSRTSSVNNQNNNNNNHTTFHADDQYSRGAVYGDVGVRSTPDHWASSAPPVTVASQATVDTTSHAPNDIYNPARSVGTVQSQRMIFESSGQPLIRPVAASGGTPPPPPPPPPQANWKAGDTPRTATGTSPPPPPPLPPPPRRVDNYDLDQKSLPDAASVRSKVEQHHAREVARMEAERLQQPGRPSLTTFSRLDLGSRLGRGDDDDGQYSLFTDNGVPDSARTLDESMKQEQQGVSHANVAAETPPSSVRHQSSHEKRSSPSRMQSASARGFIPVSPIAFSIEFDGMNSVLLDQLSDASLNRIVDELQSVLYDAVRGPVPSKGSIRVERVLASEDSDSRTVVEGFIRGMRSASDRRLAIRLLVSYFRGPSADAIGLRLVQFPALVRDANAVSVRRMYINDVDVALLSLSSAQNSPTNNNNNHQKSLDHGQGSLAAFEARRTKLSMTSTPSIIGAEYHTNGTPREVSPLRYPDRPLYHHITTPTPSSQKAVGGQQQYNPANSLAPMTPNAGAYHDPMRSPPVQQPQPNYSNGSQLRPGQTDVVPYYSPSNNYGVTRYRTRKYEYH